VQAGGREPDARRRRDPVAVREVDSIPVLVGRVGDYAQAALVADEPLGGGAATRRVAPRSALGGKAFVVQAFSAG
jgi:hypothetical protein